MNQKKNIALIAGGDSGEYVISMKSAATIEKNIDSELFNVFLIVVNNNKWVYVDEKGDEHNVDKNDFSLDLGGKKILFDCAFITIHGTPGEDGKLQGYFELLKIPYTTAGQLQCVLTFNKYFCNRLVSTWGVNVAKSVKLKKGKVPSVSEILKEVSLPVFVKPNKGGSSLGTTFVRNESELIGAISLCLEHDDEAMIEEFIKGVELTCGVFKRYGKAKALPVTELVSKTKAGFFDYEAKYTIGACDEITPARISGSLTRKIKEISEFLYEKLELKGIARFDFIVSQEKVFFLEANITPGMSDRSIVPQQAEVEGISLTEMFTEVINDAMNSQEITQLTNNKG
jgi:D-alanine-D-alanine ligase